MKKVLYILFLIVFLFINFFIPIDRVEAKTLRNLKTELANFEAEYKANQNKEQLNNAQKAEIKANIQNIQITITEIGDTMVTLNEEITQLEADIIKKNEQIKKIANFIQISSGETAYLEYIFGAKSFTDFIYRMSVAEQLSNYNKKLITEYDQLIKDKEQRKIDLVAKEAELGKKTVELQAELKKVESVASEIYETYGSLSSAIKDQKAMIARLEAQGCKLDEDIATCGDPMKDTRFYRPLRSGWVTSNFGMRFHPIYKKWLLHEGVDLSTGTYGSAIYPVANGKVVAIEYKQRCGGNRVFIIHSVNGKRYTSVYQHMYQVNVKVDQTVSSQDIIGTVGGVSWLTPWDGCSTGAHLHLGLLTGWAGYDYIIWSSSFYANLIDPKTKISLPSSFSGRTW